MMNLTVRYRIATALGVVVTFGVFALSSCSQPSEDADTDAATESEASPTEEGAGPVTTDSGLIYEVIESGEGATPKASDRVTVHYRGTLEDGTEFDSSHKRGQPAVFPVGGVIKGWTEALQLMQEGDKWRLTIPPDLAYGARGAGSAVPPNATLIFEVELIKVN
jgi:FKBP-type peptidyl-prolyl cis-trans isomerase